MTSNTLRGSHVFWMIAVFFGVTIAVNGVFIVRAVTTFPGEVAPKSYLQGLDFNATLERRARQADLGWTAKAGIDERAGPRIVVRLADRDGAPVSRMHVKANVRVPGARSADAVVEFIEGAAGEYSAQVDGRVARMSLLIEARRAAGGEIVFEARKSVGE